MLFAFRRIFRLYIFFSVILHTMAEFLHKSTVNLIGMR